MLSRSGRPLVLGLRREDPSRIWERRTPLTPDAVRKLVSEHKVQVQVEHCDRRVFRDHEYVQAGATIVADLSQAHIHLGIKETPLDEVITSPVQDVPRTHLMFSHTAKGQAYNTPLLHRYISEDYPDASNSNIARLIDYEYLTDQEGKRTVGFGWFAGVAGVLESLSAMAHSHLEVGVASPFLYTPRPHTLPSLDRLRASLHEIGSQIATEGTPRKLGPFIVGLTGTGNVTKGCLSILEELPTEHISVKNLGALVNQKDPDLRKIYIVHAKPQDYLRSLSGQPYDRAHYYQHPDQYRSTFATSVAPYLTLFLNGVGWGPSFPRLMSNADLTDALSRAQAIGGARFTNIGDISCDPEGGLEFLTRSSTLSEPFYKTRPSTLPGHLPSVQMMAVDILPASIPWNSSQHFSNALSPYLDALINHYQSGAPLSPELQRATIASHGRLTKQHEWLWEANISSFRLSGPNALPSTDPVEITGKVLKKKKVLLLGSGMVAGPVVETLAQRRDIELVIAGNSAQQIRNLIKGHTNVKSKLCDLENRAMFERLIEEADLVISLLPAGFHADIAEMCVKHRRHLVTASYISSAMRSLHERAVNADILLLNEIGLDPGIDHCSAISLVSRLQAQGKQIKSFTSFCGGLPAPDVPVVPLRYKFSWSPRGVLTAALNGARYKLRDHITTVKENELLKNYFASVPISKEFALEGLPNRDSLSYLETYNLGKPDGIQTILRGTLRYPGFSELMESFRVLGFLEMQQTIRLDSWSSFLRKSLSLQTPVGDDPWNVIRKAVPDEEQLENLRNALAWLSLIPSPHSRPLPKLLTGEHTPLDIFAHLLSSTLSYAPGERDMVVLAHEVVAHTPGKADSDEVHHSSLIAYGNERATAMACTVGLPVAIAAQAVLDGKVKVRGVAGPTDSSVYRPVLWGMEEAGLGMKESIVNASESIEKELQY
ncbi:Saccharopine dehydrogenase-domain-containing protein [Mycena amicta]|nr:Saccharopine dehydrogenase-domain-containing protein [Mycena amicta]